MSVNAVRQNENTPASYLKYLALGAVSGYALKYALPLTAQEKDENFNAELNKIKARAESIKQKEFEEIRRTPNPHSIAVDTFLRMFKEKKLNESELQKLPEDLFSKVMDLKTRVDSKAQEVLYTDLANLKIVTKRLRPTSTFIIAGAAIGGAFALIRNILKNSHTPHVETESGFEEF